MQRNRLGQFTGKGMQSGHWKGGRILQKGYIFLYMPESNLANKKGYVPFHRWAMQVKLGRPLKPTEIVHHIDHNKWNNDPDNLIVLTRGEHPKVHNQRTGRWARLYDNCIDCGTTEIHHEVGGRCYKCYYTFKNRQKRLSA